MTLARIAPEAPRGWGALLEDAASYARGIASTDFVPRAMRGNPAAIAAAILYGDEIGLGPMTSLATIAVIEGRPALSAEAQRALVLAAGHDLWLDESTATRATWCGRRAGRDEVTRVTWSMDDARRAKLEGRQNWRTYPRQMLSARASAELIRAVFADCVRGLGAIEEYEAEGPAVAGQPEPATTRVGKRRRATAVAVPAPDPESPGDGNAPANAAGLPPLPNEIASAGIAPATESAPVAGPAGDGGAGEQGSAPAPPLPPMDGMPPLPAEVEHPPMTDVQRRRMHAAFRAVGLTDRTERLRYTSTVLGRSVKSAKELTTAEADRLTDVLEGERREIEAMASDPEAQGELL